MKNNYLPLMDNNIDKEDIINKIDIDKYTLGDIIKSLLKPNNDPRDSIDSPLLKSDILTADAIHTKTDLLITSSVFVALIAIKLGFPIMDLVIAILISIFIAKSGIKIVKSSAAILCDTQSIEDTKKVSNIVLSVRGVKSCHKIRSRGRKDDIYLDLHVQVEPNMPIDKAHQISNKIETLIKDKLDGVTDVIIHLEPKH